MNSHQVDIIIPFYNAIAYIDRTIQSALDQTYDKFRILLCDDDSTDNGYALLSEKYKNNPFGFFKGFLIGVLSTICYLFTNNASSHYFVFQKSN